MRSIVWGILLSAGAALAQPLPELQFEPPRGFTGSLGKDPSAHVSKDADAIINIYPFRRLGEPFEAQFRRTLLRELLVPDSQEVRLAGPAEIQPLPVPGAEAAFFARFVEDRYGTRRYRLRVAMLSAGAVAIVDYNANGPQSYQANWPAIAGVLDSLKVGASAQPVQAKPAAAPGGVPGLYLASTRRLQLRIGGPPGSGEWVIDTRFYLLSADGRFHRGYGLPSVPGGDVHKYDFAKAERDDAPNTGTFTLKGDQLLLRPRSGDAATGKVAGEELRIENLTFKKAALKN